MSLRAWVGGLVLAALAGACDGQGLSDSRFQTARRQRSILALTKYLQDDYGNEHNGQARALIEKKYHWLLGRDEGEGLARTLLEAVAAAGDPRITLRVDSPTLSLNLDARARDYFATGSVWDYVFSDGASAAARSVYPFESVVFDHEESFDYQPGPTMPVVDVAWNVSPTEELYSLPPSIVDITAPPEVVAGIQIELELSFFLEGRSEPLVAKAVGRPVHGFSYSANLGFASAEDLYRGMLESAVQSAVSSLLAHPSKP